MEFTTPNALLQPILDNGMDGMAEVFRILLNEAMRIERENALNAGHYERSSERLDYANGYKPKHLQTRYGKLSVDVPQTRSCDFYPSCLEKGIRSERAITIALAEMYFHGVATRNVTDILEKMCGLEVSAMQVSRAAQMLDEEFEQWRNRPLLDAVSFLLLDARYEKVRVDGLVIDCALFTAYGVQEDGHRRVLGVSVGLSEAEVHWRTFLESLANRGLHGLKMISSDDHCGLKAARKSIFPSVPWQRCQFHLQQNASNYVPRKAMHTEVHEDIRNIFNMPSGTEAEMLLKRTIEKYRNTASHLADWMEHNLADGFTVFGVIPESSFARKRLRTTNMVEFQNKELKKRTRPIRVFPNKESLLRIATALLVELDETWLAESKPYIGGRWQ